MIRLFAISILSFALLAAQTAEQSELNQIVGDAANSPADLIRGLERFLRERPDTTQRPRIEQTLAKAAIEANDSARIVLYGEKALAATSPEDLTLLDRVIKELAEKGDAGSAKKAIDYARRYQADIAGMRNKPPQQRFTPGQWSEQLDRAQARALALEAQATGNAGMPEAAVKTAEASWAAFPNGEGAREAADWLARLNRNTEAVEWYANAFTLPDARSADADRAQDRARMGALYSKLHGSEQGLGDLILQAYDRTSALMNERAAALRLRDPNAEAASIFDFTLPSVDGSPALALSSLRGRTVVVDFWATWCVPCRVQHPMIESVKAKYKDVPDVVFLSVDSDEDRSLVAPFLKQQEWPGPVYFEGGLERRLLIASIPTVLILNPGGQVSSRMAGFVPERFENLLAERIEYARAPATKDARRQ